MIVRKGKSSWWQIVRIGKSSWWQDTQQRSHLLLQQLLSCKRGLRTQSNPSRNWTALSYNLTKDVSSLPGGPSIPRPGIPHTFLSHVHVDAFHGLFTCVVKRFPMPWQINLISWFQWCRRCSLRCTCIRGSFKVQHHPCLSVSASLYVWLSVCASVHVWHITHKLYIRYTLYMHAAPPATQAWNIHDNWHQILWQHWDVTLVALPS